MTPFQFILSSHALTDTCNELFSSPELKPSWKEAFEQCRNYRQYLRTLPIDDKLKIKSYLLKREDIEALLSQGDGTLDGVRIYIGHEHFGKAGFAVRLFAVACEKKGTGRYDDWQIPKKDDVSFLAELGEARPCPDECGSSNDMNTDREPVEDSMSSEAITNP